jgi:hypothetical protein
MKARSIKYNHEGISTFEEISSYLTSAVARFFEQIRADQENASYERLDKRRMLNQYHIEMFDGLPLEERLKTSNYRF